MALNQFSNQPFKSWLIVLGICVCFAYYHYNEGYDYAQERMVTQESLCDDLFRHGRRSFHSIKVMGCRSQVQDRQKKLESQLGFEASNMSDQELMMMMQRDLAERKKRSSDTSPWLARCDGDIEACMENTPQDNRFDPAPSAGFESHTTLSPDECEEVDNAGFLPECRGW